ncbi:uncharacterized protein LOC143915632 [Arctopsyche grandis]|uniref:uncharacterized protein LOC143915632 n=1 Tax=Arctopsyche grandis TaxID=121162 RepID=UPI00406D8168
MGDFDQQTQMKHGFSHIQWMQNFYAKNMYSDIKLIIKNKRYAVHKSILHMASAMFRRLLNDNIRVLKMDSKDIREISVSKAIEFLYKGTIAKLQIEQIENIIKLAELWQLDKLKDYCYLFGERIFRDNSQVSQRLEDIDYYFINNFLDITTNIRFLNLSVENVIQLLSSDGLKVTSEEQVFKGLSQWVKHDWINRKMDLYSLMKCLRLPLCSVSFLLKEVRALCCESVEECQLLLDAILWHQFPQRRSSLKLMNSDIRNFGRRVLIVERRFSDTPGLIEMYNPTTNSWTNFFKIDINITMFSAETFQNNLIIFGGWDTKENRMNDKVYSFNLHTKNLTDLAPMNKEKYDATSVIINKRIFFIGGYNGGSVDTVEEYNIIKNSWKTVASMKNCRRNHASVVYKGKIYVFGGTSFYSNDLSSVEVYDPKANRWTELSPMTLKRRNFPAVVVNDSIYCIGGDKGTDYIGQVEKFDPKSNSWTEVSNMPVKDNGFQAIYHDEKIICFGGMRNSKIQVYDPAKKTWEIIGECPNQRAFYVASNILLMQVHLFIERYLRDNFPPTKQQGHIFYSVVPAVMNVLINAASTSFSSPTHQNNDKRFRVVPRWNDRVASFYLDSRNSFIEWVSAGRPSTGEVADRRRHARHVFKKALKLYRDQVGGKGGSKQRNHACPLRDFKQFWNTTNGILAVNNSIPVHINGIYNQSVSDLMGMAESISGGKATGWDSISTDHVLHIGKNFFIILSRLFNVMILHEHVPEEFSRTTIVPVLKSSKLDASVIDSYRPIALATILSKILEKILSGRLSGYLFSANKKFGF